MSETDKWKFHNPPPQDAVLWRYMDFTKFIALLETRSLFFARADSLGDPFEGALPQKNMEERYTNLHPELQEAISMSPFLVSSLLRQFTRLTWVSCWHEGSHESEAMWKLYSSAHGGIAIKTDFNAFVRSFNTGQSSETIHFGRVQYLDYATDLIPEDRLLSPYLHKRKSFEHEREVRAIVQDVPTGQIATLSQDADIGISYEVDLNRLVQEVIIDPFAPGWLYDLVNLIAIRYNLDAPIVKSSLANAPIWSFPNE